MHVSIIVAVSDNGVIGRGGGLPWHLANDLRRFKQITMGHTVVMGRRTWESIGRPLPGRRMVVVSRQPDFRVDIPEVQTATSLDQALQVAKSADGDEAFIIGGAELYRAALPIARRLYMTRVHAEVTGDTFFPSVSWNDWRLVASSAFEADQKNSYPHTLEVYERTPN
jgi:dihydrofolate reductase